MVWELMVDRAPDGDVRGDPQAGRLRHAKEGMTYTLAVVEAPQRAEPTVRSRPEPLIAIDPLQHPAWDSVVARHPQSSFFHGTAWARVLEETYGHRPVYFCRFVEGSLEQLLPIMEVSSLWTGRRGVSLSFTDFCLPLG